MKKVFVISILILLINNLFAQKPNLILPTMHVAPMFAVAYTPDDRYIVSSSREEIKIWRAQDYKLIKTLDKEYARQIIAYPGQDAMLLICDQKIKILSLNNFTITKTIPIPYLFIKSAVFSNDNHTLYLAGERGITPKIPLLCKIDISTGDVTDLFSKPKSTNNLFFRDISINNSNTELMFIYEGYGDRTTYRYNLQTKEVITQSMNQNFLTYTEDDNLCYFNGDSDKENYIVKKIDKKSGAVLWEEKIKKVIDYGGGVREKYYSLKKNKHLLVFFDKQLFDFDFKNKKSSNFKLQDGEDRNSYNYFCMNNAENMVVVCADNFMEVPPSIKLFNYPIFSFEKTLGVSIFDYWTLRGYHKKNKIAVTALNGNIKNIEFSKNGLNVITKKEDGSVNMKGLGIAPNDDNIFLVGSYEEIQFIDNPSSLKISNKIKTPKDADGYDVVYSNDGTIAATIGATTINILDVKSNLIIKSLLNGYASIAAGGESLGAISPDNKYIVAYGLDKGADGYAFAKICCWNIVTGEKVWEKNGIFSAQAFTFSPDNKMIFCVSSTPKQILTLNALSGNIIKQTPLDLDEVGAALFNKKLDKVFISDKKTLYEYDVNTGNQLPGYFGDIGYSSGLTFLPNEEFLVSESVDNCLHLLDLKLKKDAAKIILFEKTDDWVLITPDGRFDASDEGMKQLYYVKEKETIPLEALYEKCYTPLLVGYLLNHQILAPPDIPDNFHQRPIIKINYAETKRNLEVTNDVPTYQNKTGLADITLNATAAEDKVDEMRLFHNGKIVTLTTRNLIVEDAKSGVDTKKYKLSLLPGPNIIRAVAINSQRTESEADEIVVNYKSIDNPSPINNKPININDKPIDPIDKTATLHLIVVGINQYQNKKMSLNYALADATSFKEELEKDVKSVIANVKTYFVTDDAASKKGITDAFAAVQQNAKPQDVFIFYYAGHGVIGKDKEFYLVPTDVSNLADVQTELEQKGIPSKLLQQYAIDIQAQKQLFILDACQSAGAFETLLSNDGNQQKSLAVVARSTGTHWMAASGAKQYANEFASLGHGVFTYILLQALKGEAANNKQVTVNGLKNFLQIQVPALMKKYNGEEQYPASYGVGNDFPVEVVK